MRHGIDQYAALDSPIHRWDPRLKLVALLALAFAFAFVEDLRILPLMMAVALVLAALSRLPAAFVWARLRYPGFFIVLLGFILPFLSGDTILASLGPLALRMEGSLDFVLIAGRFAAIVTVALVIFGTAPVLTSIKAMRALGLPPILADMTLISYRFIYELGNDLVKMQRATRLRGFRARRPDRRTLVTLASLVGSLLVRSHERSERIYHAMLLRGYGQAPASGRTCHDFRASPADVLALCGTVLLAAGFVVLELL